MIPNNLLVTLHRRQKLKEANTVKKEREWYRVLAYLIMYLKRQINSNNLKLIHLLVTTDQVQAQSTSLQRQGDERQCNESLIEKGRKSLLGKTWHTEWELR